MKHSGAFAEGSPGRRAGGSWRLRPIPAARPRLEARASDESGSDGDLAVQQRKSVRRPRLYKVLLHNDDFTTMEFVVEILVRYFRKSRVEATRVMLEVHHRGIGVAGVFTYEVAETKVAQVTAEARQQGMPLKCTVDPA